MYVLTFEDGYNVRWLAYESIAFFSYVKCLLFAITIQRFAEQTLHFSFSFIFWNETSVSEASHKIERRIYCVPLDFRPVPL